MLSRHSFIVIYTIASILMVQSLFAHTTLLHIYMAQFPLLPLLIPLCLPFVSLPLTWHPPVVIGIVHLPLRLLVNWPHLLPFTQLTHPSQIPRTPPAPRQAMTTSGIFRLLLIRTVIRVKLPQLYKQISLPSVSMFNTVYLQIHKPMCL